MTREVPGPDRTGDLYSVLEVSPKASKTVIQAAYRALVRDCHPDRNGTSPEVSQRIRQLNEAYRVLSSPEDRARYDLAAARSRRSERMAQAARSTGAVHPASLSAWPLAGRAAYVREPVRDRSALLTGHVVLGLVAVIAVALIVTMIVLAALDPDPQDATVIYPRQSGELIRP